MLLAHVVRWDKPFATPSYIRAAEAHSGARLITRKMEVRQKVRVKAYREHRKCGTLSKEEPAKKRSHQLSDFNDGGGEKKRG